VVRKIFITGQILWLLCAVALVVGCQPATPTGAGITLRHTPLHPENNQSITLKIDVNEAEGVKEVRLDVYEYEAYIDNGQASFIKREGGKWGLVETWSYSSPETIISESYTLPGFPANSYITYKATVITVNDVNKEGEVSFAAGDWPWSEYAIPVYGSGDPKNRIDICFVPDEDYNQDWEDYMADMEELLYDGFSLNDMYRNYHVNWRFYYTRNEGNAEDYPAEPQLLFDTSYMTDIDVFVILHTVNFRDARWSIAFSTEAVHIGTALHETGHAVFYLADEYCCDGGYWELEEYPNIYDTLEECQAHNRDHNWPESDCTEIDSYRGKWYRPEPDELNCIMRDDGGSSMRQYGRTCQLRIMWYYEELASR
jgi:hypothetical protein